MAMADCVYNHHQSFNSRERRIWSANIKKGMLENSTNQELNKARLNSHRSFFLFSCHFKKSNLF